MDESKKIVDIKANSVRNFSDYLDELKKSDPGTISKNAKVVIITSFGIVKGTVITDCADQRSGAALINSFRKIDIESVENIEGSKLIATGNDIVLLIDVDIEPFQNPKNVLHYESLMLYSDHIAGITLD
jgi:hypothetical protein